MVCLTFPLIREANVCPVSILREVIKAHRVFCDGEKDATNLQVGVWRCRRQLHKISSFGV